MRLYPPTVQSLASLVRQARTGKTQRDFAHDVGVSLSVIYKLEQGQRIDQQTLDKLLAYFGPAREAEVRAAADQVGVYSHKHPRARKAVRVSTVLHQKPSTAVRKGDPLRLAEHYAAASEGGFVLSDEEMVLIGQFRGISEKGQEDVLQLVDRLYKAARSRKPGKVKG